MIAGIYINDFKSIFKPDISRLFNPSLVRYHKNNLSFLLHNKVCQLYLGLLRNICEFYDSIVEPNIADIKFYKVLFDSTVWSVALIWKQLDSERCGMTSTGFFIM